MIMLRSSKMEHSNGSGNGAQRACSCSASSLSVLTLPVTCPPSPALSNVTLTPGRTRNLDQDMEALRISRQDNPFIQQVLASRESLDCLEESESDDTILMSQEFLTDLDADPLSLPEIHEHMIRSPPPTTWPKSPNYRAFRFPASSDDENENSIQQKSPLRSRLSLGENVTSDHGTLTNSSNMYLGHTSSPPRAIPRPHSQHTDRFLLLNHPVVSIRSLSDVRRSAREDSIQLMSSSDE